MTQNASCAYGVPKCVIAVNKKLRHSCVMADEAHFRLRIPRDLKEWVEKEAEKNHRSINAEIVHLIDSAKGEAEFHASMEEPCMTSEEFDEALQSHERVETALSELNNSDLLQILAERLLGRPPRFPR
ncbi:Arc family DNA-binding protein [Acetobacter sp. A11-2]